MARSDLLRGRFAAVLTLALALGACGDTLDQSIPRPTEAAEGELMDLVEGPVERSSALNLLAGRGFGIPTAVRVDQSGQWDIAFALVDGEPRWLPRGFFEAFEPSSGIRVMQGEFEEIERLPSDREAYELEEPVPVTVGVTYGLRSRTDPSLSLPCHVFAKLVADSVGGDPMRVWFRVLWNPNCDDTNVTPGASQ
ncbi:MAG: hypothetical protein JSV86_00590 [Gemmatimonadota bacterium]|nr:MAG: hypothetical protein JSV86_00590 [Gemmatimonadota bacterium]